MVYLSFLVFTDSAVICMVPLPFIEFFFFEQKAGALPLN